MKVPWVVFVRRSLTAFGSSALQLTAAFSAVQAFLKMQAPVFLAWRYTVDIFRRCVGMRRVSLQFSHEAAENWGQKLRCHGLGSMGDLARMDAGCVVGVAVAKFIPDFSDPLRPKSADERCWMHFGGALEMLSVCVSKLLRRCLSHSALLGCKASWHLVDAEMLQQRVRPCWPSSLATPVAQRQLARRPAQRCWPPGAEKGVSRLPGFVAFFVYPLVSRPVLRTWW